MIQKARIVETICRLAKSIVYNPELYPQLFRHSAVSDTIFWKYHDQIDSDLGQGFLDHYLDTEFRIQKRVLERKILRDQFDYFAEFSDHEETKKRFSEWFRSKVSYEPPHLDHDENYKKYNLKNHFKNLIKVQLPEFRTEQRYNDHDSIVFLRFSKKPLLPFFSFEFSHYQMQLGSIELMFGAKDPDFCVWASDFFGPSRIMFNFEGVERFEETSQVALDFVKDFMPIFEKEVLEIET